MTLDADSSWFEVVVRVPTGGRATVEQFLFARGVGAIEERTTGTAVDLVFAVAARSDAHEVVAALQGLQPGCGAVQCEVKERTDSDWRTRWVADVQAVTLTERVRVCPRHLASSSPDDGTTQIVLDVELAFGFGEHPSTRVVSRALASEIERRIDTARKDGAEQRGPTVLDVGCGTGVLAFVAACHGAGACLGVDHDPAAVAVATRNAFRNGLDGVCRFSDATLDDLQAQYDVVVANIELATLSVLASAIRRRCRPRGAVVVAGFLTSDVSDVVEAFGVSGYLSRDDEDDWCALTLASSER